MFKQLSPQQQQQYQRVIDSIGKQQVMHSLAVELWHIDDDSIELRMPYQADYCQQHGFIHAGIISTVLDSACGYSVFGHMPEGSGILTIEFKCSLLAPAQGDSFAFRGRGIRKGRHIHFAQAEAFALKNQKETLIATMSASLMCVQGRDHIKN